MFGNLINQYGPHSPTSALPVAKALFGLSLPPLGSELERGRAGTWVLGLGLLPPGQPQDGRRAISSLALAVK